MSRHWKPLIGMLVLVALLLANLAVAKRASAHMFGHWHRSAPFYLTLVNWASAYSPQLQAAVSDSNRKLDLTWIYTDGSAGADVYAIDGDYGGTNWCGQAEVALDGAGHIVSSGGVVRYNYTTTSCRSDPWFAQGIFCQEFAHHWG